MCKTLVGNFVDVKNSAAATRRKCTSARGSLLDAPSDTTRSDVMVCALARKIEDWREISEMLTSIASSACKSAGALNNVVPSPTDGTCEATVSQRSFPRQLSVQPLSQSVGQSLTLAASMPLCSPIDLTTASCLSPSMALTPGMKRIFTRDNAAVHSSIENADALIQGAPHNAWWQQVCRLICTACAGLGTELFHCTSGVSMRRGHSTQHTLDAGPNRCTQENGLIHVVEVFLEVVLESFASAV